MSNELNSLKNINSELSEQINEREQRLDFCHLEHKMALKYKENHIDAISKLMNDIKKS